MSGGARKAEPLFSWPDAQQRRRLLLSLVWLSFLFVVVYGGADYITSLRPTRFPIHFAFERSLPFVPELSVIYSSVYLMFGFIALALRDESELRRFVARMSIMTLLAGLAFLVYPAELAFETPAVSGWAGGVFWWADSVNLTYNCAPSLHVAYAVLCAEMLRRKRMAVGVLFHVWAFAIAISAWLTYQHHLVDLISGYVLAFCMWVPNTAKTHLLAPLACISQAGGRSSRSI